VAVLVVVGVFILMLLTSPVSALTGTPLTENENFSYDLDGPFTFSFLAPISFDVVWNYDVGYEGCKGEVICPPCVYKFYSVCTDFLGHYSGADLLNKNNIDFFDVWDSCDLTEHYTAGETYETYLVDWNNPIQAGESVASIKANKLRDKNKETDVDAESIFITAQLYGEIQYIENFLLNFIPEIDIIYPLDNSYVISNFEMEVDYAQAGGYDRLMVVFEDWNASSTCPEPTDFSYWVERSAYFNSQSMPYFSDRLATSTGTTTFEVYGLGLGKYNCNKCHFVNDSTGVMSENLCKGYDVEVGIYVLAPDIPEFYLPFGSWPEYYAEHSEKYDTPTPLYDNLAWTFEPLINNIGNIIIFFNSYFDKQLASEKGAEFGNVVPVFRGYLDQFNDFFGGLPISELLLFYLITAILVIIYRIVRGILTILFP